MKETTDSSTLHNSLVTSSQENLQENKGGANSMPTQAPTESHKSVIVQSSPDEFDAVAKAESKYEKFKKKLPLITFGLTVLLVMLNIIRIFFV